MTESVNTENTETASVDTASPSTPSVDTASANTGNAERGYRKSIRGIVVSDKMDKTIVVEVEDLKKHALYGKVLRTTKKVKAHDEQNTAGIGDRVVLAETRPQSATKRWRLVEIVERAK